MQIPTQPRTAESKDQGFTLIELLVVVVIIGVLAAIAIPVFLNQREKAADAAAKSDLKNAATIQESYLVDNNVYAEDADIAGAGYKASSDVTLAVVDATTTRYCMRAQSAPSSTIWYYDSSAGGLLPKGATCDAAGMTPAPTP